MSKTLIGMVTFGNLPFTQLSIKGIRDTVTKPYDIFMVVGKPGDSDTVDWLNSENISFIWHAINYGFPYSINDIYDYAWKLNNYDNLIIIGNDVIPYKYSIDSLIDVADKTDHEWVCAREYNVKNLVTDFPQTKPYFSGASMRFNFQGEPWKLFNKESNEVVLSSAGLSDVHNLALYKKSILDRVGYIDVNYYPAYYSDNDYVRRAILANTKSCSVSNAFYFHFWSRTIHQGSGGSDNKFFENNRKFYIHKWGGDFGKETHRSPFNDADAYRLENLVIKNQGINIQDRGYESSVIEFWRKNHG